MVVWLSVCYARSFAIAQAQMRLKLVHVIQNSGVLKSLKFIKVYGDTVWTFRNVHYIAIVHDWGVSVNLCSTVHILSKLGVLLIHKLSSAIHSVREETHSPPTSTPWCWALLYHRILLPWILPIDTCTHSYVHVYIHWIQWHPASKI